MTYNIPILIQIKDEDTEKWTDYCNVHARINKSGSSEYLQGGAIQSKSTLRFDVRYSPLIKKICNNTQIFRIIYEDEKYNISDFDDFMMQHKNVTLLGESYV